MLKNLKVSTKLFAVLVAPVVVLVLLAVIGITQRNADAQDAARTAELAEFTETTSDVISALERENILSSAYVGAQTRANRTAGEGAATAAEDAARAEELKVRVDESRKVTDEAIEAFTADVESVDPGDGNPDVQAAIDGEVTTRIEQLPTQRKSVDDLSTQNLTDPADDYRAVETAFLNVEIEVSKVANDPDLATGLRTFTALTELTIEETTSYAYTAAALEAGYTSNKAGAPCVADEVGVPIEGDLAIAPGNTTDPVTGQPVPEGVIAVSVTPVEESARERPCNLLFLLGNSTQNADELLLSFNKVADAENKTELGNLRADSELVAPAGDIISDVVEVANSYDAGQQTLLYITVPEGAPEDTRVVRTMNGDPNTFVDASLKALDAYDEYADQIIGGVIDDANSLQSEAEQSRNLYFLLAAAAIAISLLIAFLVARATTVPLAKLTTAAYSLSTDKLPGLVERLRSPDEEGESLAMTLTPIDIDSKDEVGQLAEAFNSIQQVTIEVAEEQANLLRKGIGDIFINLARRNQTLLDRQIEFIDQLEANEEDPDQLDNLFKLDHLATRMRRNAESLLVLAGAEPPRRRGRPVALADVVRVAIGEVEDFARIQLLALDDATVGGNVAVDLAHLLSELMENATHFSPPDTTVEIVGHRAAEGYVLSVTDQGIGMSAEQLADANTQLARPPLVGLSLSRSLGFIVIGRLASRFNISVKLTASPSGGVTALVTLPSDIVEFEDDGEAPARPALEKVAEPAPADEAFAPSVDEPTVVVDPEPAVVVDEAPVVAVVEEPADELVEDTPTFLDEVSDDDFDRGLADLVSGDTPPGPAEPEPLPARSEAPVIEEAPPAAEPVEVAAPAEPVAAAASPVEDITAAGLVKRTPKKRVADAPSSLRPGATVRTSGASQRSPEEVRKMLSRYRSGLNRGRTGDDGPENN